MEKTYQKSEGVLTPGTPAATAPARRKHRERVYISGHIGNLPRNIYLPRFMAAERAIREQGYKTMNPAKFLFARCPLLFRVIGYRMALLIDMWMLDKFCQRIYMIPGWEQSTGASIESFFAYKMGVRRLPTDIKSAVDASFQEIVQTSPKTKNE